MKPTLIECFKTLLLGLNDDQLEWLGSEESVIKTSRRDLPYVISQVKCFFCVVELFVNFLLF